MLRRRIRGSVTAVAIGILVAGCSGTGATPSSQTATESPTASQSVPAASPSAGAIDGSQFKVCYAVDVGGIADHGFYQSGYEGLVRAQEEYGIDFTYLTATGPQDYTPMLNTFIEQGDCDTILAVGFVFGDTVREAAEKNPDQRFIMLDAAWSDEAGNRITYDNVANILFADEQNSFLAGYLAAGMTKSGVLGTWSGLNIVPTVQHTYGYFAGMALYNERKGTDVKLLGWDQKTGDGTFTGSFSDQQAGRRVSEQQIGAGADILFSMGGQASLGELAAAEANPGTWVVWVDTSICDDPTLKDRYCELELTSTLKRIDNAVVGVIERTLNSDFPAGVIYGDLASGAVDLAKFPDIVPADLAAEIEDLRQDVISGRIVVPRNPGLPGPAPTGVPAEAIP